MDYNTSLDSLPVRPGDTVYYVWKSKDGWRLSEERVRSILFGEDGKLRVMITNTKEKSLVYGEDMVYRTLEEALNQYTILTGGILPRPRETGPVNIVTRAGTIVRAFYITPGSDLPEGFFDMEREEITMVDIFTKKIRIPDEDVMAWLIPSGRSVRAILAGIRGQAGNGSSQRKPAHNAAVCARGAAPAEGVLSSTRPVPFPDWA